MNYCSKCGKPLAEGSTFCSNCGAAAEQTAETISETSENSSGKKFNLLKLDVFSTDEPLKPKIIFLLVLIGCILWGWLGDTIEKGMNISMPPPVAMIFLIPLIASILVQGIMTFILCWRFFRDRIILLIPTFFLSAFGSCFWFIIIPIVTIRHIVTFFIRKNKQRT